MNVDVHETRRFFLLAGWKTLRQPAWEDKRRQSRMATQRPSITFLVLISIWVGCTTWPRLHYQCGTPKIEIYRGHLLLGIQSPSIPRLARSVVCGTHFQHAFDFCCGSAFLGVVCIR
jgi:hypothetical protein